jgi:hypothetical protein
VIDSMIVCDICGEASRRLLPGWIALLMDDEHGGFIESPDAGKASRHVCVGCVANIVEIIEKRRLPLQPLLNLKGSS